MSSRPVYRIDLSEVPVNGQNIEKEVEDKLGFSIQELSSELAFENQAILLLDYITLGERPQGALPREIDLENLAEAMLDYCPSLVIVLRTRSNPTNYKFEKVQIGALDEADLKAYISKHTNGGINLATVDVVSQLMSITGGVPEQIDRALKALKVVTLSELVASHAEDSNKTLPDGSHVLIRALEELESNDYPQLKRAHEMLQALATFPYGVQFEHIKRFNGVKGFYPDNATELIQRALITASTLPGLEQQSHVETRRILSVPRTVRDVVRARMSDDMRNRNNRRAAELYFGTDWRTGSTNWPPDRKYSSPKCSHHEIANASAILLRLLKAAIEEEDSDEILVLMHLAAAYSDAITTGSHYYGATIFCTAFFHTAPTSIADGMVSRVKLNYGIALRMTGGRDQAIKIFEELDSTSFDRADRELLLLHLALAYESSGDNRAVDIAKQLLKAKTQSSRFQAESIIIEAEPESPQRKLKLVALEKLARKKKSFTVANNIAITLSREDNNPQETIKYLNSVINTKESSAAFNANRAIIDLAEIKLKSGEILSDVENSRLISAYQYLFIQRTPYLFDKCHRVLWMSFLLRNETVNLFALFRHSSFLWRLRGTAPNEGRYLNTLSTIVNEGEAINRDNRDVSYFITRLNGT